MAYQSIKTPKRLLFGIAAFSLLLIATALVRGMITGFYDPWLIFPFILIAIVTGSLALFSKELS